MHFRGFITILCLIGLLLGGGGAFCADANAGVIAFDITPHARVTSAGEPLVDMSVVNRGDTPAHRVVVFVFLDGDVRRSDPIERLSREEKTEYSALFSNKERLPGRYTAVIRVVFEEPSGRQHAVFSETALTIGPKVKVPPERALAILVEQPVFNQRSFWQKEKSFGLTLHHEAKRAMPVKVRWYMAEPFVIDNHYFVVETPAGTGVTVDVPVSLGGPVIDPVPYVVTAAWTFDGHLCSTSKKGALKPVSSPVLFKWYLGFAVAVLAGFTGWTVVRRRTEDG